MSQEKQVNLYVFVADPRRSAASLPFSENGASAARMAPIYAAFEAARPIRWLQLLQDERVARVKSEKVAKLPAKCIEIQRKHENRSVCVYDNGTLAALRSSFGWDYEYSEYAPFEKAQLPGRIRVVENDSLIVELQMNTHKRSMLALTFGMM